MAAPAAAPSHRERALKNAAAAAHWLDRPHGGLGNKSPKTAAANVETFEQAINLLQGPQAVVA